MTLIRKHIIEEIGSRKHFLALSANAQLLVKLKFDKMADIAAVGPNVYIKSLQAEVLAFAAAIQEGHFVTT